MTATEVRASPSQPEVEAGVEADDYDRQNLYNGFGDTMAKAVEFVAAPCLLAWFGHFIDGRAGTGALFTVALSVFGVTGVFLRLWFGYVEAMKEEEARGPWNKK